MLFCLLITGYFAYHASQGKHGLETRARLQARSVALNQELERLEVVRTALERETTALAKEPPDLDLIDEHARRALGYLHPDDIRLVLPGPRSP